MKSLKILSHLKGHIWSILAAYTTISLQQQHEIEVAKVLETGP